MKAPLHSFVCFVFLPYVWESHDRNCEGLRMVITPVGKAFHIDTCGLVGVLEYSKSLLRSPQFLFLQCPSFSLRIVTVDYGPRCDDIPNELRATPKSGVMLSHTVSILLLDHDHDAGCLIYVKGADHRLWKFHSFFPWNVNFFVMYFDRRLHPASGVMISSTSFVRLRSPAWRAHTQCQCCCSTRMRVASFMSQVQTANRVNSIISFFNLGWQYLSSCTVP